MIGLASLSPVSISPNHSSVHRLNLILSTELIAKDRAWYVRTIASGFTLFEPVIKLCRKLHPHLIRGSGLAKSVVMCKLCRCVSVHFYNYRRWGISDIVLQPPGVWKYCNPTTARLLRLESLRYFFTECIANVRYYVHYMWTARWTVTEG